ncbi:MAG: L,D-transpeptidase family protein [Pseudomonadota bacterium]|nr:L,D-transpeptidase family protein [Pseudomonadota bacterium]
MGQGRDNDKRQVAAGGLTRRTMVLMLGGAFAAVAGNPAAAFFKRAGEDSANKNFLKSRSKNKNQATTVTEVVEDERDSAPMLFQGSDLAMMRAIARYERIVSQGGWPKLDNVRKLGPGSDGPAVLLLKKRLAAEGYLALDARADENFDAMTKQAVLRFQRNHGLAPTGRVDKQVAQVMNVPADRRLATLRANLPRVEEYSRDLGTRYIVVNIPAAQLEAVTDGSVYSRHNIIAGKPERPSPVVSTQIADLNFNPYWNAPASIVEKDIIPAVLKDPRHLDNMNIRIFDGVGGPEVDPATIDWANTRGDRYHFRQEPGGENAMATVKINFPSPFGVYMHDTPAKKLFTAGDRYFSSGCVRVDQVHVLVDWILRGQDGWDRDRISMVSDSSERVDVKVSDGPQLRWVYLTAWAAEDGRVHFRPDIYDLDSSGFIVGQPLPVDGSAGSQRWTLEPIPYGVDDNPDVFEDSNAALVSQPEKQKVTPQPQSTNFKPKKLSNSMSTLSRDGLGPSFGQQDSN